MRSIRNLAAAVLDAKAPPAGLPSGSQATGSTFGVVVSVQTGPPPTLTITLGGSSTSVAGVTFLASYTPVVGDTVLVWQAGADIMVVGRLSANLSPSAPWGTLGYAQTFTAQTGITSQVDLTSMSKAVTVGSGRRIRISACLQAYSTVAGDNLSLRIQEGSQVLKRIEAPVLAGTDQMVFTGWTVVTPTAGTHTYKLTLGRATGTGTVATFPQTNPDSPVEMLIEDIGT